MKFLTLPLLLVSSCAGTSSSSDENCLIKEDVSISLWSITDEHYVASLNEIIAEFEQQEPHVTVKSKILNGSYNNVQEGVTSGFALNNYPDLVQCYPDHVADYLTSGKVIDLTSIASDATFGLTEEDRADYIQSFMEEGRSYTQEGTYSVPWDKSTEVMFYNEDILIGLDLSGVDSSINSGKPLDATYLSSLTWEEMFGKLGPAIYAYNDTLGESNKIIVPDSSGKMSILAYDSDENLVITLLTQYEAGYTSIDENGNGSIDFNNDDAKAVLKMVHDAHKAKLLETKTSYNGYTSSMFTGGNALFAVASTTGATYNFDSSNPMNVGVTRIPHAEGKKAMCINQGPSLCLLDHGEDYSEEEATLHAEASWLFYKFLTNKENALKWSLNTDYMPVRSSVYEASAYQEVSKSDDKASKSYERLKALTIQASQTVSEELFSTSTFRGSSMARTQAAVLSSWALSTSDFAGEVDATFNDAYATTVAAMGA
ncbi:MAG: extracellular solute-binding protein [Bacilli bacterium]|nr:extracellular solute-binding protein [Bacilli bacterium]